MNDKIDEILKSIDGIKKATAKPFLLTRVNARIKVANALPENIWYKIAFYLKKPSVAFAAVMLLILINIFVIKSINHRSDLENIAKNKFSQKYDFAINVSVLYDIDNQEP